MVTAVVSRGIFLLVSLVLAVVVRLPAFSTAPGGGELASPAVHTAISLVAKPAGVSAAEILGTAESAGPAGLLRGLFEVGLLLSPRSGFPSDRFRLKALFDEGSQLPARWARWCWLTLQLLLMVVTFAVATSIAGAATPAARHSPLAAPFLLALAPLAVGGALRIDGAMPAALLGITAWMLILRSPQPSDRLRWAAAGFLLGLATIFHPLALLLTLLLGQGFMRYRGLNRVTRLAPALAALALGMTLGDPRLLEDPLWIAKGAWAAALGPPPLGHEWSGLTLLRGASPVPLALALAGLWRFARVREWWILGAITVPLAALLASPAVGHSAIQLLMPLVALAAASGLAALEGGLRTRSVAILAAVALVVWPGGATVREMRRAERGDSRTAAERWLAENLPEDAKIVADFYGPRIPGENRVSFLLPFDATHPAIYAGAYRLGWYEGFETFVLVGTQVDRYRRDPETYRVQLAFVGSLRQLCRRAAVFSGDEHAGPTVEILTRRVPATPGTVRMLTEREVIDPPILEYYLSLGSAYARMGREVDALALYEVGRRLAPDDPRVALNLAGIHLARGEEMAAERLLRAAVQAHPDDARLRYQYGLVKQRRKLWGEAIAEYKMALRLDPGFVEAHFNLGTCYLEAGNRQGAINSFRMVSKIAPPGRLLDEAFRMLRELGAP